MNSFVVYSVNKLRRGTFCFSSSKSNLTIESQKTKSSRDWIIRTYRISGESDCEYSWVKKHNKNEFGDKNTKKRNEISDSSPSNHETDDHFCPVIE